MRHLGGKFFLLAAVSLLGVVASLATGASSTVSLHTVYEALVAFDGSTAHLTVVNIRVPRTLVAVLLGINMALAGLALQAVTRNPLASPSVMGVVQSAAFLVALAAIAPAWFPYPTVLTSFMGGLIGGAITFVFAGGLSHRVTPERLVLSGVAVSALAIALVRFTFVLDDDVSKQVINWMTGSITDVRWHHVQGLVGWSMAGVVVLYLLAHPF